MGVAREGSLPGVATCEHNSVCYGAGWGNPPGLKIRSIGERGDNLFVVEFGSKLNMDRVLASTPWIAGRHAVILKDYDEKLKPSDIRFDRMDIWVRILNLPLEWMNEQRGIKVMRLLGEGQKMHVDGDGKASGVFLRARVAIELKKPIKRGVLLRMSRNGEPKWFDAQYEKLPFLCFSCGILGHGGMVCDKPAIRNEQKKLPYERDPPLRAPDERRLRLRSFVDAAAESFGSAHSSCARSNRSMSNKSGDDGDLEGAAEHACSNGTVGDRRAEEGEVTSPLTTSYYSTKNKETLPSGVGKQLFTGEKNNGKRVTRKRKPRRAELTPSHTPDLNL